MAQVLTMQQIADLAGVRRPVVSTWRRRFAGKPTAFPEPVDPAALLFDAHQVGRWLEETGRGKNREAGADAVLYSTLVDTVADRLADTSALLLLHALAGVPLSGSDPAELLMLLAQADAESVLPLADAAAALEESELVAQVDALVEAGVTATRVFARLVRRQETVDPRLGAETLTAEGDGLAVSVLTAVTEDSERLLAPWGPGGLRLVVRAVEGGNAGGRPRIVVPEGVTDPVELLLWRYLVSLGCQLETPRPDAAVLTVGQWAAAGVDGAEEFFDELDRVVIGVGAGSAALVLGPAPLLVDRLPDPAPRRRVLGVGSGGYLAPLRYVARLPAGMCRFGGRRRLALWALGHPVGSGDERRFTTYGEHSAHALDAGECRAVGHDVAAALRGGGARRSHAFLRSAHRVTGSLLPREALAVPLSDELVEDGGDALARLWERRDASAPDLFEGVEVEAAGSATDRSVPWAAATTGPDRPARVITGVRIPPAVWAAGAGGIGVIGPEEVRGEAPVGSRTVDLVALVEGAPRSRLTEPGDVVFVTTTTPTGPAAIIDAEGGNVVQAPARILRCLAPSGGGRRILPETAVRDICASRGSDPRAWRLRTVVVDSVGPWRTVAARAARRRARLERELAALDAVTTELSDGLAAGTLRIMQNNQSDDDHEENA